ncbi:hypothetical protein [Microcoleus sp. B3-D7]|uniref:hypothetical protein n=1 Tax=Microcoleus sp. B3-D7 TaxID=2818659 RepID=UPI002FD66652
MQVGVDLLRKYNTILTLPTPTAPPVRCGHLRWDVSRQQGCDEVVQVLSVDLRFETAARHSASAQTFGAQSSRQVALSRRNYLRFEIYSTDESGSLN